MPNSFICIHEHGQYGTRDLNGVAHKGQVGCGVSKSGVQNYLTLSIKLIGFEEIAVLFKLQCPFIEFLSPFFLIVTSLDSLAHICIPAGAGEADQENLKIKSRCQKSDKDG